jgi:flagellar protein FlaG
MGMKIPGTLQNAGPQEAHVRDGISKAVARERPIVSESFRGTPLEHDIRATLASLEKQITRFNRRFEFSVDQSINRIIVKVIDRETDKVIKEIPPQEIQHLLASLREMMGLLVDEEI